MNERKYLRIVSHYESCLEQFGDTHRGVDWPKQADVDTRYRVMLDVIRRESSSKIHLLDFGCGASHLYDYILRQELRLKQNCSQLEYSGLDLSEKFITLARSKFPCNQYYRIDVLDEQFTLPEFDYIVMNGVFTEKCELSFDEMFAYFQAVIGKVFPRARTGIAFNVMSKQVDWEREDLFHLPFDTLASFLTKNISRNFVFRHDYGLYEYTVYVYRY